MAPVPEVRKMIAVAKQFVAGEVHFSWMIAATREAQIWSKVHNLHPTIQALIAEWSSGADRVWNEFGQCSAPLTVEEYRDQIASDLEQLLREDN